MNRQICLQLKLCLKNIMQAEYFFCQYGQPHQNFILFLHRKIQHFWMVQCWKFKVQSYG